MEKVNKSKKRKEDTPRKMNKISKNLNNNPEVDHAVDKKRKKSEFEFSFS